MPRQARLDAPGALHHIMVRGINKTEIFSEAKDKKMFIERLSAAVIEGQCAIYAWAVMDNHSLLFRSGKQWISDKLIEERYRRFRKMGSFIEAEK